MLIVGFDLIGYSITIMPIPALPSVVAKTIVQTVQAQKPKTRYTTGGLARTMLFLRRALSDHAFDAMFRMIERQMLKSKV